MENRNLFFILHSPPHGGEMKNLIKSVINLPITIDILPFSRYYIDIKYHKRLQRSYKTFTIRPGFAGVLRKSPIPVPGEKSAEAGGYR